MLDASGIIHVDADRFLVAEDETDILRYFSLDMSSGVFEATGETINLGNRESDFESLAYSHSEDHYYCIGSHDRDHTQRLWRFQKDGSNAESISFDAGRLLDDVNIESLTVWQSKLLVGYRSPSRNGLALAIVFDTSSKTQLLASFDLEGRRGSAPDCTASRWLRRNLDCSGKTTRHHQGVICRRRPSHSLQC